VKKNHFHNTASIINLNLDDAEILRLVSCVKMSDGRESLQILFKNKKIPKSMFVMTWNLDNNVEYTLA
jgi:hypothetical protein